MKIKDFSEFIILFVILITIIVGANTIIRKTVKLQYKSPLAVKNIVSDPVKIPEIKIKHIDNSLKQQIVNNFLKSERSSKDETKKIETKGSAITFNLNMIIISETNRIAYVNNFFVKEGDFIEGYKVEKIVEKGVLLSKEGEKIWIQ